LKNNKKGSTLITTVIILMFITTVSLATLSMVSTNYYGRVGESKRIQNLYGSESGLDTTYNIINKTVTAANYYGNKRVEKLKNDAKALYEEPDKEKLYNKFDTISDINVKTLYALYEDIDYWKYYNSIYQNKDYPKNQTELDDKIAKDNEAIYNLTNKVFKDGFKDFINEGKTDDPNKKLLSADGDALNISTSINKGLYIDVDGTPEEQQIKYVTPNKVYMGYYLENLKQDKIDELKNKENDMLKPKGKDENNINVFEDKKPVQLWMESGYTHIGEADRIKYDPYTIDDVEFTFNKQEEYAITVTSEFKNNSSDANTSKAGINQKVIEANYSIRVPNYDEIAFKSSAINVQPKDYQAIPNLAIGGNLQVEGVKNLTINGDIFVQGNDLQSSYTDVNSRIPDKYSGGMQLNNDLTSSKNTITFNNNVYTRGTFNIKNNVNVSVKGDLYAKNMYAGSGKESAQNSQLTVTNDVVVDNDLTLKASTTAISLKNFYGINGKNDSNAAINNKVRNSSSIIVNDYTNNDSDDYGIRISDDAYIMGVAHINNENGYQTGESVAVKGNYEAYSTQDSNGNEIFKEYNSLTDKSKDFLNFWKNKSIVNCGGVYLNSNKIYSAGAIVNNGDNQRVKDSSAIDEKKEATIKEKQENYAKNIYTVSKTKSYTNNELFSLYTNMGGNTPETVKGCLNDVEDYNFVNRTNDEKNFAMFSTSDTKTIVIKGENSTKNYDSASDNCIIINAHDNNNVNAVIITKGNIIIDGDVNFKGTIIAGSNLKVIGNVHSAVTITYDEALTKNVLNNLVEEQDVSGLTINSNSTNFIKNKLWKIIQ